VFGYQEEYEARIPAADLRTLAAAQTVEMRIRGKAFTLGERERPHLSKVAAFTTASTPAPVPVSSAATPAGSAFDARALLEPFESQPLPEPSLPKQALPSPLESPVWALFVAEGEGSRYLIAAQLAKDATWDHEAERYNFGPRSGPYLAVGDSVSVFSVRTGRTVRLAVHERVWGGPGEVAYCFVLLEPVGWAYFLDPMAGLFSSDPDAPDEMFALPFAFRDARAVAKPSGRVHAALAALHFKAYTDKRAKDEREGAIPEYVGPASTAKEMLASIESPYNGNWALWEGPNGPINLLSAHLADDYGDKGQDTWVTFLIRDDGTQIARMEGRYNPVFSADLDGDGVQELVTSQGVVRFRGGRWVFPKAGESEYCD
jgi:hypothetical protein